MEKLLFLPNLFEASQGQGIRCMEGWERGRCYRARSRVDYTKISTCIPEEMSKQNKKKPVSHHRSHPCSSGSPSTYDDHTCSAVGWLVERAQPERGKRYSSCGRN